MQKKYPFKFLDAYEREDRQFFYGREEEIDALYEMVFQSDLILVYGASGTGKTSLLQCGLASRFESHDWLDLYIRHDKDLNKSLEKALDRAGGSKVAAQKREDLAWLDEDWLNESTSAMPAKKLSPIAQSLKAIYLEHFKPIYLIFDQFEELYTVGTKAEQSKFIATVKELLKVEQPVKIILSIREEYLGYLYEFEKEVPELLRKKLRVEPMNLDKVKAVVQGVGSDKHSNISLKAGEEEEIGAQIFDKIKGEENKLSIPLPYLQVFFDKLYLQITGDRSRKAAAEFSLTALREMKDIDDILRDFLDEQVEIIGRELKVDTESLWRILSPFVTLEGTKEPREEKVLAARFREIASQKFHAILQAFVNRRILRFREESEFYEIAHDSLALQIHHKRDEEEVAIMEVQRLLKSQMAIKPEDRGYFAEKQLELVELYQDKLALGAEDKAYIKASRQYHDQEKEKKRKRRQRLNILGASALIIMAGLTIWAFYSSSKASRTLKEFQASVRINEAEELKLHADAYLDLDKVEEAKRTYIEAWNKLKAEDRRDSIYIELRALIPPEQREKRKD